MLAPLLISFIVLQREIWGWEWCGPHGTQACYNGLSALSWLTVVFPHALAYPLAMAPIEPIVACLTFVILDLLLCAIVWRWTPARLQILQFAAILTGWTALSVATTFAGPDLMAWVYRTTH